MPPEFSEDTKTIDFLFLNGIKKNTSLLMPPDFKRYKKPLISSSSMTLKKCLPPHTS